LPISASSWDSSSVTVRNPALPDDDFDEAVRIAQAEFDHHQPNVVVGFD